MTGDDLDDPDSEVTPALDAIQNRISIQSISFEGQNEDGSALSAGIFSWSDSDQAGSLSFNPGHGFSGTLTAVFDFDETSYTVSGSVSFHIGRKAYLTVTVNGEEFDGADIPTTGQPLTGRVRLYTWNASTGEYDSTLLTADQIQSITTASNAVTLTKSGETVTIAPVQGITGDYAIMYDYGDPSGNPAEFSGRVFIDGENQDPNAEACCVTVEYDNAAYEIEFLAERNDGTLMPYGSRGGYSYRHDSGDGFFWEVRLGIVSRSDPDDPDSEIAPAPEAVRNLLTLQRPVYSGQNEDGSTEEPNWQYSWDETNQVASFTAPCKAGFSGMLTADFEFNGEPNTIQTEVFYTAEQAYLSFLTIDAAECGYIQISPGSEVAGGFRFYQWEDFTGEFSVTTPQREGIFISRGSGLVDLVWDDQTGIATLSSVGDEGEFAIGYDYGDPNNTAKIFGSVSGNGANNEWRACVEYDDTSYEIEFLASWGGALTEEWRHYHPIETEAYRESFQLAIVTVDHPEYGDMSSRTVVTDETITGELGNLSVSFEGSNEDGAAGDPNWSMTWNDAGTVILSADCQAGFSGMLTASFDFNGEPYSIRVPICYLRMDRFLSFTPSDWSVEQFWLQLDESTSFSGSLKLYVWDGALGEYAETPLTYEQHHTRVSVGTYDPQGPSISTSWDEDLDRLTICAASGTGQFWISYHDDLTDSEAFLDGFVNDPYEPGGSMLDQSKKNLCFEGENITVSTGWLQSGSLLFGGNYGDSFKSNEQMCFSRRLVLGGLLFYQDQTNETYAPVEFFDRIVSCRIELGLKNGTMPTVSDPVKVAYPELGGAELFTFELNSAPNTPFNVTMAVIFEYKEDDWEQTHELSTYTIQANAFFKPSTDETVDASDLDTTEKLNAALRSRNALEQYLEEKGVRFSWKGTAVLELPSVEYEGVVTCSIMGTQGVYGVALCGTADPATNARTTIHALEVNGGVNFVEHVNFTASESVMQSYGSEEPFTCGILVNCNGHAGESSIYSISDCSFSGFQYAVRGTATGYQGSVMGCTISDCEYGVYVNCPELNGAENVELSWNTFIRCQEPICILRLPFTITSYMYRIHDNSFINCGRHDINITDAGTFFCYGNYFADAEYDRRTARLYAGEGTTIIANPCRENRSWQNDDPYWIDPALPTVILNSAANSMTIDASAFDGTNISIDVVSMGDAGLDMIGTWTFGGAGA